MKPASPVLPSYPALAKAEVVYAKDQPEYLQLPALRINDSGVILTRWRMTWRERLRAFLTGDVYVSVMTFDQPLQPLSVEVKEPGVV